MRAQEVDDGSLAESVCQRLGCKVTRIEKVGVSAVGEQEAHAIHMRLAHSPMQRRVAVGAVLRIHRRTCKRDTYVTDGRHDATYERGTYVVRVHRRTVLYEKRRAVGEAGVARKQERRVALACPCIDVGVALQQGLDNLPLRPCLAALALPGDLNGGVERCHAHVVCLV